MRAPSSRTASTSRCARPARSRAHASHARRAVLAVNSAARPSVHVTSLDGDWLAALGVLAEASRTAPGRSSSCSPARAGPRRAPSRRWSSRPALRRARDEARPARCGAGCQRRLGRQRQLRRPADEGRAGAAAAAGGRRRRRVVRRGDSLAASSAPAGAPERAWLGRPPSTLPGAPDRVRWLRLEERARRAPTGSGSCCSPSPRRWRRSSGCGSRSIVPARCRRVGGARHARNRRPARLLRPVLDRFYNGVGGFTTSRFRSRRRAPADARRAPARDLRLLRAASHSRGAGRCRRCSR